MKLVIDGDIPSLKNNKQIVYNKKTNRPFIVSSSRVQEWKKNAVQSLSEQFKGYKLTGYPLKISVVFYYATQRRKDLDNGLGGVADSLVQAGILEDDDFKHVDQWYVRFGGIDKENPRAEIYFEDE